MLQKKNSQMEKEEKYCKISLNSGEHIRHCFVNGEYCSHQSNILTERERLHKEGTINAFVIMNFSDMSDVVYRWRLNSFIESLKNYLYLDLDAQELVCCSSKNCRDNRLKKNEKSDLKEVSSVRVIRSDTESANNYVICSRICQQMLIADLVIVDVSWQNPNVFYEFGIAVALGKLILPICYSESFYKRLLPEELKKKLNAEKVKQEDKEVEHHIGCFPWRKQLFEYYGIRYKRESSKTKYIDFKKATKRQYGFSDIQYNRFPYDDVISKAGGRAKSLKIGQRIYEKLMRQYNEKESDCNTAIIYTMEGILNEEQAGLCIINYYKDVVEGMRNEKCFCGERVGVLVQGNQIPEQDKDVSENYNLLYSIAEITRTGVNQATYQVSKEKIKAEDTFSLQVLKELEEEIKRYETKKENEDFTDVHKEDIGHFVKNYIGNRGLLVYPDNPVYVDRMKNGIDSNLLEDEEVKRRSEKKKKAFCLFHVMMKTLQYTNQIVVDITNNSLQSLFWLGAAHGAEVHAVTVIHEASEYEQSVDQEYKQSRNVFDVSGLWAAIHYTHDTEGFYRQLNLVQKGIEQNSKLVLRNVESFETYLERYEKSKNKKIESESKESVEITYVDDKAGGTQLLFKQWLNYKEKKQRELLEFYYRNWFWKPILRYNRLRIYLPQREVCKENSTFLGVEKWNMAAISSLTHYLSKHSVIGEYRVIQLPDKKQDREARNVNYIALDTPVKPMGKSLPEYIWEKQSERKNGQEKAVELHKCKEKRENDETCLFGTGQREFVKLGKEGSDSFFQHLKRESGKCIEAAQLILWKEEVGEKEEYLFRVGMTGTSEVATYVLSSLFVDERNNLFHFLKSEEVQGDDNNKDDSKKEFLCDLQLKIREKLIDRYLQCLNDRILEICRKMRRQWEDGQKECYCALVKYAVTMYLSTVLYRYFFPFLSKKDIQRICNGLYMFIQSMKSERISPFALDYSAYRNSNFTTSVDRKIVEKIIEEIPAILKKVLEQFEGIEVFYEVDVQLQPEEKSGDSNSLCRNKDYSVSIQEMKAGDSMQLMINFIGLDSKK